MIKLAVTTPPTSLLLRHESLQHLLIDSSSDNFTDYFYDSNISFDFQNDAFMMKSFHAKYFELRAYKGRSVGYHKPLLSPSFDSYQSTEFALLQIWCTGFKSSPL